MIRRHFIGVCFVTTAYFFTLGYATVGGQYSVNIHFVPPLVTGSCSIAQFWNPPNVTCALCFCMTGTLSRCIPQPGCTPNGNNTSNATTTTTVPPPGAATTVPTPPPSAQATVQPQPGPPEQQQPPQPPQPSQPPQPPQPQPQPPQPPGPQPQPPNPGGPATNPPVASNLVRKRRSVKEFEY